MRFDEDYLRELELWPMFALKGADAAPAQAAHPAPHEAGVQAVDAAARRPAAAAVPRPAPVQEKAAAPAAIADPARAAQIMAPDWAGLARETAACTACGLCKQRRPAGLGGRALEAARLVAGGRPGSREC